MPASWCKSLFSGLMFMSIVSDSSGGQAPEPPTAEANSLEFVTSDGVFQTFGSGSRAMNEMRARFADPQQRAKLHEDQRQGIADSHYGVADALQLDAATFDKFISLLADQQMEQSEYFYTVFAAQGPTGNPNDRMHAEAERVTRQIEAMREILGQEKLERYQKLRFSLGQRGQIRQFDERLAPSDQLNSTQRERLVELLNEFLVSSVERQSALHFQRSPFSGPLSTLPSREEMQRSSQLHTIASNEEIWRELPESNRKLRERAAEFLTPTQLAMLQRLQEEQAASQQHRIEQMRIQAGLSPTIPEQAEVTETLPGMVNRDVKLSLEVAVDRASPKYLTMTVSGGESVSLQIADDLFLEATPTVFENDAYNLRVEYFETGITGKRRIGNMGQAGTVEPASENGRSRHVGGGGGTVLTGSKGYVVELSALVEST